MNNQTDDEILEIIAKKILRIETLKSRGSDRLDFKECAVWSLKSALKEAFKAGYAKGVINVIKNDVKIK